MESTKICFIPVIILICIMLRLQACNKSRFHISSSPQQNQLVKLSPVCNYAKGKWVADDRRPLYSGGNCKQWLSDMWACRLTGRTDFAYEKFRWQPSDCEMDEFNGSAFLSRMKNKTLAFIGDSLGRQQFQSLMCMITGGEDRHDIVDVGHEYGLSKARDAIHPYGWAYRFSHTNTTILFSWSFYLCDLQKLNYSDPKCNIAMHLDRPPAFLNEFIDRFHVLVLNTGHHWNVETLKKGRHIMYLKGFPNSNQDIAEAKNFTIHSIVKWLDSRVLQHPNLRVLYRSISPQHFVNGEWITGGTCDNTLPFAKEKEFVKEETSHDVIAARAVQGTKVKLLDITALSELRDEGHVSKYSTKVKSGTQDCLHWCLPGIPDTWNEILFSQLSE